jgi:hypothetical protein
MLNDLIERHLGITHNDCKEQIRNDLRDAAGVLWLGLHYRRRPTGGSKLAALYGKAELLAQVHEDLSGLDTDTCGLLEEQAGEDKSLSELFPTEEWFPQKLAVLSDRPKEEMEAILAKAIPDGGLPRRHGERPLRTRA